MKIRSIQARQILDSRGIPTIEADVWLEGGVFGRAAVPSGASTGKHEALELRDSGDEFNGKGVKKAIENVHKIISAALLGKLADDQFMIDQIMIDIDGTQNKSNLGANATLAVSLAVAHAAAKFRNILLYSHINDIAGTPEKTLPMPMMNFLNGGKHATQSSDFQEYMVIPTSAQSYAEALQIGAEIFQAVKFLIDESGNSTAVGDEGGFTYKVKSNTEMFDLLMRACEKAGYSAGKDVHFATDVAASEFYENGRYVLKTENTSLNPEQMIAYLEDLSRKYPLVSIEDGLSEDDWDNWSHLTSKLGHVQLVGDDLLVTNLERLERAINLRACNAILIKPNQIGTLTETIKAIKKSQENGWRTIVSHRSGETEDVTIAHLAIGTGSGQIKIGSLSRSERTAKHNELLRIESIDETLRLHNPYIG